MRVPLVVVVALTYFAPALSASPLLVTTASVSYNGVVDSRSTDGTPVSASNASLLAGTDSIAQALAVATASRTNGIGVTAFAHTSATRNSSAITGAVASGTTVFDDFFIEGPLGQEFIDTSLNLHLGGSVVTGAGGAFNDPEYAKEAIADAAIRLDGFIDNQDFFGTLGVTQYAVVLPGDIRISTETTSSGLLRIGSFGVPLVMMPVNRTFQVALTLTAGASGRVRVYYDDSFSSFADGSASFGSTLTFASDRPVFTLPEGYTAYSADAGIIDNQWRDPSNPVPVPEPTSLLLLGTGLAGLGARRWRQRKA